MGSHVPLRGAVERVINAIELTAAAFLAVVTALTFAAVVARYLFAWGIPDSHDFSRLLLGILIFWGIAVASYRGQHITVDLLWSAVGPAVRRALDLFADLVSLGAMAVFTWMMAVKVLDTRAADILTFDLRVPVWPFYLLAWAGLAAAIILLGFRTAAMVVGPAQPSSPPQSEERGPL
jgi:TRAP-type C4-dicarboxylate transport system permease small subunit